MIRTVLGILVGLIVGAAGVLLFVWLLWRLWTRPEEEEQVAEIEIATEPPPPPAEPPVAEEEGEEEAPAEESPAPDDLKRVEGIGPKIASVLQEAGITTFAQLADADVSRLEQILHDADPRLLRLAKPSTWPEQAALAAAGDWEALEALQNALKGGRRA